MSLVFYHQDVWTSIGRYLTPLERVVMRAVSQFYKGVYQKENIDVIVETIIANSSKLLDWFYDSVHYHRHDLMEISATYNSFSVMRWLVRAGHRYGFHVAEAAARNGSLKCLKLCRRGGMKMESRVLHCAGLSGDIATIEYVLRYYTSRNEDTDLEKWEDVLVGVSGSGNLETLKWVLSNSNVKVTESCTDSAIRNNDLSTLKS